MSERKGDWIQTFSNRRFHPIDPRPEEVFIEDIAHSLSQQCRFTGHSQKFYCVSEHSVRVSWEIGRIGNFKDCLWGLLHDASEAYLCDLSRPIKHHSALGAEYRKIEDRLMAVIAERFGLPLPEPPVVKVADNILLMTEKRDIMGPMEWEHSKCFVDLSEVKPLGEVIEPWDCARAERLFMIRFRALGGKL